jgi:hypothetical protein
LSNKDCAQDRLVEGHTNNGLNSLLAACPQVLVILFKQNQIELYDIKTKKVKKASSKSDTGTKSYVKDFQKDDARAAQYGHLSNSHAFGGHPEKPVHQRTSTLYK